MRDQGRPTIGLVSGNWLVDRDFVKSIVPVSDADRGTANFHTSGGKIHCSAQGRGLSGQGVHLVKPGLAFILVPVRDDDCARGLVRFHPERNAGEGNAAKFRASGSIEKYNDLVFIMKESGSTGGRTTGEQ